LFFWTKFEKVGEYAVIKVVLGGTMLSNSVLRRVGIATSATLLGSFLSLVPISGVFAAPEVTNTTTTNPTNTEMVGTVDASLMSAAILANTAVTHGATNIASGAYLARSVGLVSQDAASGVGQAVTLRASGVLSLYTKVSTTAAISATGGSFSSSTATPGSLATVTTGTTSTLFTITAAAAIATGTPIATLWTAPATNGTYTITLSVADSSTTIPTLSSPTLGGADATIVVTVTEGIHGTSVSTSATNTRPLIGQANNSLFTAVALSTTGAAVLSSATDVANAHISAKSLGLLSKNSSAGVGQTATMLTNGVLSLYANVTTTVAFNATGGTFGTTTSGANPTFNQTRTTLVMTNVLTSAGTAVGATWTAPSTPGTYTISLYYHGNGAVPTTSTPAGTLGASISVTVVATSAGGSYSAAHSFCAISNTGGSGSQSNNTDTVNATNNGGSMYINFALNDAYSVDLAEGNIVATATNGAVIIYGDSGSAPAAGTASTVVAYDEGEGDTIRVNQGTADAPLSTTVTITYNGTTVCTKTVGFAGAPTKVSVSVLETQDLSGNSGKTNFLEDGYGRAGLFTVTLTDAAGNQVAPGANSAEGRSAAIGTFSSNSASLAGQTIVTALSVDQVGTQTSTTLPGRFSTGIYTCGATAGEVKTAKIDFTISATGKVITSDAFTLRCADNPYSYTASFDKASYVQGEIATLTVKFLDSKGNPANSVSGTGGWTSVTPMLTNVSATGAAAGLGTTGSKTYTYTVGTSSGMTAGTYTAIIDFTTLTDAGTAVKATPTYRLTTASTDVAFTEVLKSVVALIASINKQIQALQKLILKRR
jgi:hypothetical protein